MNSEPIKNLLQLLAVQEKSHADRAAILSLNRSALVYGQLLPHLHKTVERLAGLGLHRNQCVAVVLPNGPEIAVCILAVSSLATCAPLNPAYSFEEFRLYFHDLNAQILITTPGVSPSAVDAAKSLQIPVIMLHPNLDCPAGIFTLTTPAKSAAPIEFAQTDDVALMLHTSGTTSRPKIVPITQRNLLCAVQNIARSLDLDPEDCCLNIMPLFHLSGLTTPLLSSLSVGASVVCSPGFDIDFFFDWVETFQPTWYSAVPTMHQTILEKVSASRTPPVFRRLRFVRSSSAALAPRLMTEIEKVLGVPVIEAYGMTEASGAASNLLPPRSRKPGSVGMAVASEVAIVDEVGTFLESGDIGEIVIRGENVIRGYQDNPEANRQSFFNDWFRTGDQGYMDREGYIFITGRIKEIINRGGEKICPREIDEALIDHPAVAQAVAFARPHPTLGEDIAAAVVLHRNMPVSAQGLRTFAMERLAPFKVPSIILILDGLPQGPTGKVPRTGMAALLADRLVSEHEPPHNDLEELVTDIWQEMLNVTRVGVHDNFFVLGGDSLRGMQVMARVNNLFDLQLPTTTVFRYPTVELLTREIQAVSDPAQLVMIRTIWKEIGQLSEEEAKQLLDKERDRAE